jgi:hypothetical protein
LGHNWGIKSNGHKYVSTKVPNIRRNRIPAIEAQALQNQCGKGALSQNHAQWG